MTAEHNIEQIRNFVAKGYTSVAARIAKSALRHYDDLAAQQSKMPTEPMIFQFVRSNLPLLIKTQSGKLRYPFISAYAHEEIEKHLSHALFEWLRNQIG